MAHASKAPWLATTLTYVAICVILLAIGLIPFWGFPFLVIGLMGLAGAPFVALAMYSVECPHCGMQETVLPKKGAFDCTRCHKRALIVKTAGGYETREA